MNKYIITGGKYEAIKTQFVYYPNKFWVEYDDKITTLYTGSDEGGGNYYELKGNYKKEVMQIVELLEEKSAIALVTLFKKLTIK